MNLRPWFAGCAVLGFACAEDGSLGQLRPRLLLDPEPGTTLVFDPVVIGFDTAEPKIVAVRNDGAADLKLGWRVEGPGQVRVSSFPKRLVPGDDGEVWARYEPTVPSGMDATTLVVESNDPLLPEARYPVQLSARDPCRLEPWPKSARFKVGEEVAFGILAAGTADCEIRGLRLDEELFALVDPPTLPLIIPAGQEVPLSVRHLARTGREGVPRRELGIRDQDGQEVKIELEGAYPLFNCVAAFPDEIRFPETTLGFVAERSVTVTNRCTEAAAIKSLAIFPGYHAFASSSAPLPLIIPPLGAVEVTARYLPFDELGDAGGLLVNTDDSAHPRLEVQLSGRAIYPGIRTLPGLDLGPVGFTGPGPSLCGSRVARLPIWSTGRGPLLIEAPRLTGLDAAAFEYLGAELNGAPLAQPGERVIVPVGQKAELLFRFRPLRASPPGHGARVELDHYARTGPRQVTLVGTAVPLGPINEDFVVGPAKVDLLFAIDGSRSMTAEQERLVVAAPAFVQAADALGADYQVAVTRGESSSDRAGELLGCTNQDPILRSVDGTTVDRSTRMGCMMRTGRRADGVESGYGAAALALERALFPTPTNPSSQVNARFLRSDTRLVIFTASDEDDGSREAIPALRDWFLALRGDRPDRLQVHALAGRPGQSCATDPFVNEGLRYLAMTQLVGGAFFEICQDDYAPLMSELADRSFVPSPVFELSGAVDPPSLAVTLDAVPLSEGADYRYDPNARTVTLSAAPNIGQRLGASYRSECLP